MRQGVTRISRKNSTCRQGEICLISGRIMPSNWENYGMLLDSGARPHILGRPPVYIGALALICKTGRPNPNFISYQPSQHNVYTRGQGGKTLPGPPCLGRGKDREGMLKVKGRGAC